MTDKKNAPTLPGESAAPTTDTTSARAARIDQEEWELIAAAQYSPAHMVAAAREKVHPKHMSTPARRAVWDALTMLACTQSANGEPDSYITVAQVHTAVCALPHPPADAFELLGKLATAPRYAFGTCEIVADEVFQNALRREAEQCLNDAQSKVWNSSFAALCNSLMQLGKMGEQWGQDCVRGVRQ